MTDVESGGDPFIDAVYERENKRSNVGSASLNLLNTMIGSGVLALPYAISQLGLIFGILSLFVFAVLSLIGMKFLDDCATRLLNTTTTDRVNYYWVSSNIFKGSQFVICSINTANCFMGLVSYLLLIDGIAPKVFSVLRPDIVTTGNMWITIIIIVLIPICMRKTLYGLWLLSMTQLCFVIYTAIFSIYMAYTIGSINSIRILPLSFSDSVRVLPIFVFAYSCQFNVSLIGFL